MTVWWRITLVVFGSVFTVGCRDYNAITSGSGSQNPPSTFSDRLRFSVTGISGSTRTYTKLDAAYDPGTNRTTIETLDDSASNGKFSLQFHGRMAGTYAYDVAGSADDVNEVYMRFVPSYSGSNPSAVFELTGQPQDSLQAEISVQHFGAVRDSITGTFAGKLKLTNPAMHFTILVYSGTFTAQRLQ